MNEIRNTQRASLVKVAIIVLLTAAAYSPSLRAGFIWDDDDYVTQNPTLRTADGLRRIWFEIGATPQYYPVVHTTFWLEYRLWKLDPFGYHGTNLCLHLLAVLLLWRVLAVLHLPGAWLAAAIFAVHPVQVESVAWVTERKNVLSAVFYFAAALAYLRFDCLREKARGLDDPGRAEGAGAGSEGPTRLWSWYLAALLLFAAALGSKTVTCSLPAALLLVCWWKRGAVRAADMRPTIPLFALGLGLSLLTVSMERHRVGAIGADWALSLVDRLLIAGRALWFYAAKLLWPAELTFVYPRWEISPGVWGQWLFPFAAVAVVVTMWFGRRFLGRGPLVAVLFFVGTLVPALGFIDTYPMRYSFVADHYQYLASVGLIALVATLVSRLRRSLGAAVLAVLAFLTWQQTHIYRDLETLWRDTLAKNPGCWMALNNLGLILAERGETGKAVAYYRSSLQFKRDNPEALNNLAAAQLQLGRADLALANVREALRLEPSLPSALSNHGSVLLVLGRLDEAIEQFATVLRLRPDDARALSNLGAALSGKRQWREAERYYRRSLAIDPGNLTTRFNLETALAHALAEHGRRDEAVVHVREALRLDPSDPQARQLMEVLASR